MAKFDLSKLQKMAGEEVEEANNRGGSSSDYPIVYPVDNGKFRVKLLYNMKADAVQRKVIRHVVGRDKMPCLSIYGEECPVCSAIKNAEDMCGKECGAFKKYGYKTRGICFAVLMDHDKGMFKDGPNVGDVILLMYPVSMYNKINEIIVSSGEHLESLVASNNGKTIEITRTQKAGGFPDYSVAVYPYGDEKVKDTDEEFDELLESLPNLNERIIPPNPTEEDRNKIKAAAETINAEYINGSVINPNDESQSTGTNTPKDQGSITGERPSNLDNDSSTESNAPEETATSSSGGRPECFGNHCDSEKCLICPCEPDCVLGM